MKKRVCVDFDGVINEYYGFTGENNLGTPADGVKEFLKKLDEKYYVVILTARNIMKVHRWLIKYDLRDYIFDVTNHKPPAFAYIDDRGLKFEGNFDSILFKLKTFKTHWE